MHQKRAENSLPQDLTLEGEKDTPEGAGWGAQQHEDAAVT